MRSEGDAATLGKRVGKDAGRNKATFVAALGLGGVRARRDALVAAAVATVDAFGLGAKGETLREAARFVAARRNSGPTAAVARRGCRRLPTTG